MGSASLAPKTHLADSIIKGPRSFGFHRKAIGSVVEGCNPQNNGPGRV